MNQAAIERPRQRLTTLRAGAAAGILFAVLFLSSLILIRLSIPMQLSAAPTWLKDSSERVTLALNLLPFSGVAFLWFIGVVRARLGALEDRLFATVFLGSGLLFLAMVFAAAAVSGAILLVYNNVPGQTMDANSYSFGRALTYQIMNVYAVKMAGVFMISATSIMVRAKIAPRWLAAIGYILALVLLLSIGVVEWITVVFPLWVLTISLYLLVEDILGKSRPLAESATGEPVAT
jgi:hypothetical protein